MSQDVRAIAARRRQMQARRRIHRLRNKPQEVTAPKDTDDQICIPFSESRCLSFLRYDVYESQGTREYMEDMHLVELDEDHSFFGVFDGHGGRSVPKYIKKYLFDEVKEFVKDEKHKDDPLTAIRESFLSMEEKLYQRSRLKYVKKKKPEGEEEKEGEKTSSEEEQVIPDDYEPISGGCCASILNIFPDCKCVSANLGDSKMVLYHKNGEFDVLTIDHDTNNEGEVKRIVEDLGVPCKPGGRVGGLKITRSFGDFFRPKGKKVICAEPHMRTFSIDVKEHHSIVIASDGLWENINEEEVFEVIRPEVDPRICTRKLMTKVVEKVRDNITICVIRFNEPVSEETKRRSQALKKFMEARYSSDDLIRQRLEYRRLREKDPNAPSSYQLFVEEKKKRQSLEMEKIKEENDDDSSSSDDDDSDDDDDSEESEGDDEEDDDD